ncbi:MAG TPA: alpha/beta hydrolase [Candidatus Saccharimonadales bacterium]|nr:alpha/beta hydrolase [Candidatus Saccharimonadales bacterium]
MPTNGSAGLTEHDITINGARLHYYTKKHGASGTVILVHGIGVSSRYMLPLAEELAKDSTVYAIDLPGFGKSEKPPESPGLDTLADCLYSFIKQGSISSPTLVGNSFGCQIILRLLKRHPDINPDSVLIGPTMNVYERTHTKQIIRWLQNLRHEPARKFSWILIKDIVECGPFRVFKTLDIGIKDKPEAGLDKIRARILFMRGALDPIAPREWLQFLAAKNPLFTIGELPKAGHALNFNSPGPLARIINDFMDHN